MQQNQLLPKQRHENDTPTSCGNMDGQRHLFNPGTKPGQAAGGKYPETTGKIHPGTPACPFNTGGTNAGGFDFKEAIK